MTLLRWSGRHLPAVLLIVAVICSGLSATWADSYQVYVNNKPLKCETYRKGGDVYVEAEPLAKALGATYGFDGATRLASLNGRALESTRIHGGQRAFVALKDAAKTLDGKYLEQPDLGIYDLVTFKPKIHETPHPAPGTSPPPPDKAVGPIPGKSANLLIDGKQVPGRQQMPYIFALCKRHLDVLLGIKVTVPVDPIYELASDIRRRQADTLGYALPTIWSEDGIASRAEIHIPYDRPGAEVVHVMSHELTHCWQFTEKVQMSSKVMAEGFCEWAASEVLEEFGFTDEIKRMESNGAREYAEGFKYVRGMAGRIGNFKTVEFFRNSRYGEKRD